MMAAAAAGADRRTRARVDTGRVRRLAEAFMRPKIAAAAGPIRLKSADSRRLAET
jgi:hypothetical protein